MTGVTLPRPRPNTAASRDGDRPGVEGTALRVIEGTASGPAAPEGEERDQEQERPYAWVLPALPSEVERVVGALQRRQERSRGGWWRRAATGRFGPLSPLDREMAAVRELRELATVVLDRHGGNRYGGVVPVSEVLVLRADPIAWSELLALAGRDCAAD